MSKNKYSEFEKEMNAVLHHQDKELAQIQKAISEIKNKNDVRIYTASADYMESITNSSKDSFKIKRYSLNVEKTVNAVYLMQI